MALCGPGRAGAVGRIVRFGAKADVRIMLERGLRGCRLIDQANEMFRVLPIALACDSIGAVCAFCQAFVTFVILSPLAEEVV